jgi:histidinol dehydrogenase
MSPVRLDSRQADFAERLDALLAFEQTQDEAIEASVAAILSAVRERGDAAVLEYTRRLDMLEAETVAALEVGHPELEAAFRAIGSAQRKALEQAAARIRAYHERQPLSSWRYEEPDGTVLGQQVTPLDRVGVYVPGGKAAYLSTVLMNTLPAKVAGVPEVVMVVPTPRGERNPLVLAAAAVAGVDRVFGIGGHRRSVRWPTAPTRSPGWTRSLVRAMPTWLQRSGASSAWWGSTWLRALRRSW